MDKKKVRKVREDSFGLLMKKVVLQIEKELNLRLADVGLNVKTFGIIMLLLEEEGLTQKELGTRTGVQDYATTRVLDSLEQQGLIERRPHPTSRRANLIFLTKKGQEQRGKLPKLIKGVNEDFLAVCNRDERKILQDALTKILDSRLLK
ncbi:MAG: MarR family transcriptional regulator [Candidatus Krumholzibacteria bacterium]|nr:MarR family transcriptional regulator [Candidatus Krumholzibacteria bacterium]